MPDARRKCVWADVAHSRDNRSPRLGAWTTNTPNHTGTACLSVAAAAEFLDVHPKTVRALVERGELPAYRVGRTIKIAPEGIEALRVTPDEPLDARPRRRPRPVAGQFSRLARELS